MTDQAEMAVEEEVIETPEVEETPETSQDEPEGEETEETGEEEEIEEVEYEGKKYQVPQELKAALLRQADYTKKTQEVAEQRRAFEQQQAETEQVLKFRQENLQGFAQLAAIDSQLQQYSQVDWQQYSQEDAQAAQQAFFQYNQLKEARGNLAGQLHHKESEALHRQREELAKRVEEGRAALTREIKDWTPQKAQELSKHGETYGFTAQEMSSVADPRMVRVLHDAYLYRQMLNKATPKPETKTVKPMKSIKGKTSGSKDPEKMSTDEWMAWRNKQIKR